MHSTICSLPYCPVGITIAHVAPLPESHKSVDSAVTCPSPICHLFPAEKLIGQSSIRLVSHTFVAFIMDKHDGYPLQTLSLKQEHLASLL